MMEEQAFYNLKLTKQQKRDIKFEKRIQKCLQEYMNSRHLYFHPLILIDDGRSFEVEQALLPCRFEGCVFDHLVENAYVCAKHLSVHLCKSYSKTCVSIQSETGPVYCVFTHRELSNYGKRGKL